MPKSSQKKGGAKREYTGTYRHFTLHEVDGKSVTIGTADIKDHQTPLNAAKKLLSSYCRHEGIKSNERNKVNITFTIRETTRGHSKVYGPYKGKFVKYDKPLMIKLKSGKVIKRTVKPMVSLKKNKNNSKMVGGQKEPEEFDEESLKEYIKYIINNNYPNIPGKDFRLIGVQYIENMDYLFMNFDFNKAKENGYNTDISKWDVSNVVSMIGMFYESKGFNEAIGNWKVDKVENINNIFGYCSDLDQEFNWDLNKIKECTIIFMFSDSHNLFKETSCFPKDNVIIKSKGKRVGRFMRTGSVICRLFDKCVNR